MSTPTIRQALDAVEKFENYPTAEEAVAQHYEEVQRRNRHLAAKLDEEAICAIEEHFQTHLPCFQGSKGNYDQLDAMRRDAHREVCLWLRHIVNKYKTH